MDSIVRAGENIFESSLFHHMLLPRCVIMIDDNSLPFGAVSVRIYGKAKKPIWIRIPLYPFVNRSTTFFSSMLDIQLFLNIFQKHGEGAIQSDLRWEPPPLPTAFPLNKTF
jgi:hypothetical protein